MAETVFTKQVFEAGLMKSFRIDSAGIIDVHQGEMADHRMRLHAANAGYNITHRSRPVKVVDFDKFDFLVAMDEQNVAGLKRLARNEKDRAKIIKMTDFSDYYQGESVPDPYYGGADGFLKVIEMLEESSRKLLEYLTQKTEPRSGSNA